MDSDCSRDAAAQGPSLLHSDVEQAEFERSVASSGTGYYQVELLHRCGCAGVHATVVPTRRVELRDRDRHPRRRLVLHHAAIVVVANIRLSSHGVGPSG